MKATNKLFNKLLLIPTAVGLGVFTPQVVWAIDPITQLFASTIMQLIMSPFFLILQLEMWLLKTIAQYNNFINQPGVVIGWTALRDVSNMMFILVLLVIAFATILKVRSYGYKQLLSRLIIVAILINFSRTFVGLAIDLSQVVMLTFVQAIKDVSTGNLVVALGLSQIGASGQNTMSTGTYLGSWVLGAFMLVLAVLVIGVFIAMLAARIVTLWILTVLSPLAFLAYVFPRTQGFFNKWLSQLGSNLFSGPVLVFFLWLAFTITGRGDIYTSFVTSELSGTVGGIPVTDVSTVASPGNVMNYVIAMVLLVSALKFVGASGAAGASVAARAHKGATGYAAKLARRYPGSILSRAGAVAASRFVTSEGEAKRLFGVIPSQWARVPFVGGRVQRLAQKMQGYNAARIQKEREEDMKYISPVQRTAFLKSQQTLGASKTGWRKWGGLAYSAAMSQGGNFDKDALLAAQLVDRGEITHKNAKWATNLLRRTGDEERMQKIQGEYWTFKTKEEAMRLVRKKGINGLLGEFSTHALYDEKGNANEGADIAIDALFDSGHGHADPNAITAAGLKLTKKERWGLAKFVRDRFDFEKHIVGKPVIDIEGGAESDKRDIVSPDFDNEAMAAMLFLAKTYPQDVGDVLDNRTGEIAKVGPERLYHAAARQLYMRHSYKAGQVASRMKIKPGEDKDEFAQRKQEAAELDGVYLDNPDSMPEYLRGRFIDPATKKINQEKFEEYRKRRYLQLNRILPMTEDKYGNSIDDPNDDTPIIKKIINEKDEKKKDQMLREYVYSRTGSDEMRTDIMSQYNTLAKETPEATAARRAVALKSGMSEEDFEEYEQEVEDRMRHLRKIVKITPDKIGFDVDAKIGEGSYIDIISRMFAETVGNMPVSEDYIGNSLWTEVGDGMHGSRLAEANVNNPVERAMFNHASYSGEHQHQGQFFAVGTEDQTAAYVAQLAKSGKIIQKQLMENIEPELRAVAMQTLGDVTSMRNGILPQDFNLVGNKFDRIVALLQALVKNRGLSSISQLLNVDQSLKRRITALDNKYSSDPKYKAMGISYKPEDLDRQPPSKLKIQEAPPEPKKKEKEGEKEK